MRNYNVTELRKPRRTIDTHGNSSKDDVITPLAAILQEIVKTHDNQAIRTQPGAERAALQMNIMLAAAGYSLERLY